MSDLGVTRAGEYCKHCTCIDSNQLCYCDSACSLDNTMRIEPCALLPENEALRRRIMELEILLSRQGCIIPDELKVLQAENCHFRDLTYARLAEVEYWKKLYANERRANADRLAKLEEGFKKEIEELLRKMRKEIEDQLRAKNKADLDRLRDEYESILAQYIGPDGENVMQKDVDALRFELDGIKEQHVEEIRRIKKTIEDNLRAEMLKLLQEATARHQETMKDFKKLRDQYKEERKLVMELDKKKFENLISVVREKNKQIEDVEKMSKSQFANTFGFTGQEFLGVVQKLKSLQDENNQMKHRLEEVLKENEELIKLVHDDSLDSKRIKENAARLQTQFANKGSGIIEDRSDNTKHRSNVMKDLVTSGVDNFVNNSNLGIKPASSATSLSKNIPQTLYFGVNPIKEEEGEEGSQLWRPQGSLNSLDGPAGSFSGMPSGLTPQISYPYQQMGLQPVTSGATGLVPQTSMTRKKLDEAFKEVKDLTS